MVCVLLLSVSVAHAHGDTHEEDEAHATTTPRVLSMSEMEQMVKLLQQLVAALTELQRISNTAAVVTTMPVPQSTEHEEDHVDEMEGHVDEHHEDAVTPTGPQLVIEIEPHFGKTHAHLRYTDKPEEMFFVDVTIDNEDGIVDAIVAKTGLAADVVRAALKYMQ